MRDNLKELVDQSREEFEVYRFDEQKNWDLISRQIIPAKRGRWRQFVLAGMAACFMFMAGWVSFQLFQGERRELSPMAQEWLEAQRFYEQEIGEKLLLVRNKVDDPRVLAGMEDIDRAFAELKGDLQDDVDNEDVIIAMMNNYRLKLKILEQIIEELDDDGSKNIDQELRM